MDNMDFFRQIKFLFYLKGNMRKILLENMYLTEYGKPKDIVVENAICALFEENILYEISDTNKEGIEILALVVNCNDVFWWACSDYEYITYDEIQDLYELCFDEKGKDKPFGSVIWACLKRKMRPQHPLEDMMKKNNVWNDKLESLPIRGNTG
jgi:hypothetical protein